MYACQFYAFQDAVDKDIKVYYIRGTSLLNKLQYSPVKAIRDLYKMVQEKVKFYSMG